MKIKVEPFCHLHIFIIPLSSKCPPHNTTSIIIEPQNLFINNNNKKSTFCVGTFKVWGYRDLVNRLCFLEIWNNPELGLTFNGRAGINQLHWQSANFICSKTVIKSDAKQTQQAGRKAERQTIAEVKVVYKADTCPPPKCDSSLFSQQIKDR